MTRKEGLDGKVNVTARGVVVITSSRKICIGRVTVTAWGVVEAEAGAWWEAELGQSVPNTGVGSHDILDRCNIKSMLNIYI